MSRDGRYRAVLDRIEDGVAVLLVEEAGEVVDEAHVDPEELPAGVDEGAVLRATYDGGNLRRLVFEPEETARRRSELQERFDDLSERPPGRRPDRPDDRDDGDGAAADGDDGEDSGGEGAGG